MSFADSEAPIASLSAKKYFDQLPSIKEKLYAHYLSRASYWGTRAILRSVSPESESIYDLILAIYAKLGSPNTNEAYVEALKAGVDADVITKYLEYASAFISNLGNYRSFGDNKFIPALSQQDFDKLIATVADDHISQLYHSIRAAVYDDSSALLLGWSENGHTSNYYPQQYNLSVSKQEAEFVNEALASKGIMPENTRVVKKAESEFVVLVASANTSNTTSYYPQEPIVYQGLTILFQFGDHSKEFVQIVANFREAAKYVANDTQAKLLAKYIESFETGSMNAHKESQIEWVKDLNPLVESNIGFIETYRDPSGVRGEWEGMVAMVNQEQTAKFARLVAAAETLIPHLPWDSVYEKDKFTPPDFTSLEVLSFATSGVPAGINIPNYDDVRLNYGFKNVSLGNVLSANPKNPKKEEVITFIDKELAVKFKKYREEAFEVQVGLHELLGHGTGKLLQEVSEGKFNFDKEAHPEIKSWYKLTETWGSLFGSIAGSFEECRAELVALFLILKHPKEVLPIFGFKSEEEQNDVVLIATVLMCRAGLIALEFWDPSSKKWGQAHMQGRFGIFQAILESGAVEIVEGEAPDYDELELKFDTTKFDKAGDILGEFLHNIHVYKTTANFEQGAAYYIGKTDVNEYFAKFRDTVLRKKLPRKQIIQGNTFIRGEDEIEVKEYEETEAGLIQSYAERAV